MDAEGCRLLESAQDRGVLAQAASVPRHGKRCPIDGIRRHHPEQTPPYPLSCAKQRSTAGSQTKGQMITSEGALLHKPREIASQYKGGRFTR